MAVILLDENKTGIAIESPSGQPEGTFTITQNGTYNISNYQFVEIALEDA